MTGLPEVSFPLAFMAGLISFISPCCLPLIPAYIGYMSARAAAVSETSTAASGVVAMRAPGTVTLSLNRLTMLLHGVMFVLGFTLIFVTFGILTNSVISPLRAASYNIQITLAQVGGLLVIFFGLHFLGVTGWALRQLTARVAWEDTGSLGKSIQTGLEKVQTALYSDTRRQMNVRNPYGYLGTALLGIVFAAGWSPCIGPVLGTILTLAATASAPTSQIALLMTAYSLGLGVPFLLATVALDRLRPLLRVLQRRMRLIEIVGGLFLVFIGYLLLTNQFATLNRFGSGLVEFSANVEECSLYVLRGRIPASEFGRCMAEGRQYEPPPQQQSYYAPLRSPLDQAGLKLPAALPINRYGMFDSVESVDAM
jgi:cytochrome c-type biogenesis protein